MSLKQEQLKLFLTSLGNEVIRSARQRLQDAGKGSGSLEQSLYYNLSPDLEVIEFYMREYGKFVDKGVKGAGGKIKTGKHAGVWGGRRHYVTWEGQRKDSPYRFGSGKSRKYGKISTGIGKFIRRRGIQPRDEGGRYMTTKGLKAAIIKVLWTKGIHGISFFQKPLGNAWNRFGRGFLSAFAADLTESLKSSTKLSIKSVKTT